MFNVDETMLALLDKRLKVYTITDNLKPKKIDQIKNLRHITLVCCVAADGEAMQPTIILPLKFFPADLTDHAETFHWAGSSTGWITDTIYRRWVSETFIPFVAQRRNAENLLEEPALLWSDGHGSRADEEAIDRLTEANILHATFPAHTSHILQPLDRGVFRHFKPTLTSMRSKIPRDGNTAETRKAMISCADKAWYVASYRKHIEEAWKSSGIWPWRVPEIAADPAKVDQEAPMPPSAKRGPSISGTVINAAAMRERLGLPPGKLSSSAPEIDPSPHTADASDDAVGLSGTENTDNSE